MRDVAEILAEACAAYGLPPEVCPSRVSLLRILRWAVREWMRYEGEGDGA